jgi:hypothetical protein
MREIYRFFGIIIAVYFSEHNPPHFKKLFQLWTDLAIKHSQVNINIAKKARL